MADGENTPVVNYAPPAQVASNSNVAALIEAAVKQALADQQAQAAAAAAPKVLSPEEAARAALDRAGEGLGVEERLQELYAHLAVIAKKVGI